MKTLRLNVTGIVSSRSAASGLLRNAGDAVVVDRNGPRWLLMRCPCGCGSEIPINLDSRSGPAWRLYKKKSTYTLYPSVWRDTDCESHFIVSRGIIYLLGTGRRRDEESFDDPWPLDQQFISRIAALLGSGQKMDVFELSDQIPDSTPWDVMRGARTLVNRGIAREGSGRESGIFWAESHSRSRNW